MDDLNNGTQGDQGGEEKSFVDTIPEEFRDKPWVKENATTPENFFKFVDNQNALVGKKGVIVPGEGASEAELNDFYKALGRPDTPDEYETPPIDEMKDVNRDEAVLGDIKKLFHTNGVPKATAAKISQGFEKILYERGKTAIDQKTAEDKAFVEYNTKLFGDNKDTIVANAQKIIKEDVPKELHPGFDKLDAEAMSVVVAITDSLYKKYGKEDAFRGGAGEGNTQETFEEVSSQQRELMKHEAYSDFRHPEHEAIMAKNKILMSKMRTLKP